MGGTFDPPHMGHLFLAEYIADEFGLHKVMFIPTGKILYKTAASTSARDRYEMTKLAIEGNPRFDISDIETNSQKASYSADTLTLLKHMIDDASFYFFVGADSLDYMDKWKTPEKIFSLCTVVAVGRKGFTSEKCMDKIAELEDKFNAKIEFIQMPDIEISSSSIRERIRDGKSVRYMLPDCVREYITKNKLYIGDLANAEYRNNKN